MNRYLSMPMLLLLVLVTACGRADATPRGVAGTITSSQPRLAAVSLSQPSAGAQSAIELCHVSAWAAAVRGMAEVPSARDLPLYVPLTGREPEIQTDQPAWVVAFGGEVALWTRSGAGAIRAKDPTCVVIDGWRTWYLTGGWSDATGALYTPMPAAEPVLTLPALLP